MNYVHTLVLLLRQQDQPQLKMGKVPHDLDLIESQKFIPISRPSSQKQLGFIMN